jgi:hypothetical protein
MKQSSSVVKVFLIVGVPLAQVLNRLLALAGLQNTPGMPVMATRIKRRSDFEAF